MANPQEALREVAAVRLRSPQARAERAMRLLKEPVVLARRVLSEVRLASPVAARRELAVVAQREFRVDVRQELPAEVQRAWVAEVPAVSVGVPRMDLTWIALATS
jgi:hypothetical protein